MHRNPVWTRKNKSAYSVSVALRASIALWSQPGASSAKSIRDRPGYTGGRNDSHLFSSRHRSSSGFVRGIERSGGVVDDPVTRVTSSWASCEIRSSKGMRGIDDDAVPEISSGSRSLYPVRGVVCQPENRSNSRGSGRRKRGSYRPCRGPSGGGSVKSDQVPRGKLWGVIKSAFICFGQAGEGITLYCLIGDDDHPYRIFFCDDPISSRARQLNRDIAEVPRASDRNVVNVSSSMMTASLIKSGPCSGKWAHQHVLYGPKVPLWRSRRAPNR